MEAIGAVITIREKIQSSPFRNVYWFSRYLMNTDQYGAPGKTKELQLMNLAQKLEQEIKTVDDVLVFCIAMKYVVAPINRAMALIPADDKNSVQRRRKIFLTLSAKKKLIC